jgi:hypothetical protein
MTEWVAGESDVLAAGKRVVTPQPKRGSWLWKLVNSAGVGHFQGSLLLFKFSSQNGHFLCNSTMSVCNTWQLVGHLSTGGQ